MVRKPVQLAMLGNRNRPGLLGDDDTDGIRPLCNPNSRAVAGPKLGAKNWVIAQRKETPSSHQPILADQDCSIVQR